MVSYFVVITHFSNFLQSHENLCDTSAAFDIISGVGGFIALLDSFDDSHPLLDSFNETNPLLDAPAVSRIVAASIQPPKRSVVAPLPAPPTHVPTEAVTTAGSAQIPILDVSTDAATTAGPVPTPDSAQTATTADLIPTLESTETVTTTGSVRTPFLNGAMAAVTVSTAHPYNSMVPPTGSSIQVIV